MMTKLSIIKIIVDKKIIDRRDSIRYLILPEWHTRQLGEVIERPPDATFNRFVEQHVLAYLKGKIPPDAIQSAVMNIADQYISGGEIIIRAGDYIALQNEFHAA